MQHQPPLEKGIFSICEMVIFGLEMSRMSVLVMTSHSGFWISWEQSISNSTCFGCPKTAATCTHPGYPTTESEWWLPCLLVFILLHFKPHIRPLVQRGFTESKSTQWRLWNQNSFLAYHTERERKIERSRLCRRQSSRGVYSVKPHKYLQCDNQRGPCVLTAGSLPHSESKHASFLSPETHWKVTPPQTMTRTCL